MIRNATQSDIAILAEGLVRLQQMHVDAYPNIYKPFSLIDAYSHLTDLMSRTDYHIRVVIHSNRVAGHAVLAVESSAENMFKHAQRYGHLTQIEIAPDTRRLGLGRLLLSDIDEFAAKLGLNRILLDVWAFNGSAHAFFSSASYNRFGSKLTRTLTPN